MNRWIRQFHRWVSIVFTLAVIANFVARARGGEEMPPEWVTYSPLLPLALLVVTGLWLFVLPYLARWRRGGRWEWLGRRGRRERPFAAPLTEPTGSAGEAFGRGGS